MEIVQLAIGIILLASVALIQFKILKVYFGASSLSEDEKPFCEVKDILYTLKKGKEPSIKRITKYAEDNEKRVDL